MAVEMHVENEEKTGLAAKAAMDKEKVRKEAERRALCWEQKNRKEKEK